MSDNLRTKPCLRPLSRKRIAFRWAIGSSALATLLAMAFALGSTTMPIPAGATEPIRGVMLDKEQSKPWRGVGRINIAGLDRRGMCTGTLIAPDIVLTAAHCLVSRRTGRQFRTKDINFVTGWYKGTYSGHSKAKSVVLHPAWSTAKPTGVEDLGRDLAVVRLATPIAMKAASSFKLGSAGAPGDEVLLLSYRRDRPHALTQQKRCRYLTKHETVVTLACRIVGGTSGAPVFEITETGPRIVAVISAKAQVGQPRAFAARVDDIVDGLIGMLPE